MVQAAGSRPQRPGGIQVRVDLECCKSKPRPADGQRPHGFETLFRLSAVTRGKGGFGRQEFAVG